MDISKQFFRTLSLVAMLAVGVQVHAMDSSVEQFLLKQECGCYDVVFVLEDKNWPCIRAQIMDPFPEEIGCIQFSTKYADNDSLGSIDGLYLYDSLYAGKHIGSCLMSLALDIIRSRGCTAVRLDPVPLRFSSERDLPEDEFQALVCREERAERLIKFYKKCGFEPKKKLDGDFEMMLQFDQES